MKYTTFSEPSYNLSDQAFVAVKSAEKHGKDTFNLFHLFQGLLQEGAGLGPTFKKFNLSVFDLKRWADQQIRNASNKQWSDASHEAILNEVFPKADALRLDDFLPEIQSIHLLKAVVEQFPARSHPIIGPKDLLENSKASQSTSNSNYCFSLLQYAKDGEQLPLIAREAEIRSLIEALSIRQRPHALLIGEAGVGKTSIAHALADRIIQKRIPAFWGDVQYVELDLFGSLLPGAGAGGLETRLLATFQALEKHVGKTILLIEDIHTLMDKDNHQMRGAFHLLKAQLAKSTFSIIGTTTPSHGRLYIEADPAIARSFSEIKVAEPNEELSEEILAGLFPQLQDHYQVTIQPESAQEAVFLAKRYFSEQHLPASALELLEQTAVAQVTKRALTPIEIKRFRQQIKQQAESPKSLKKIHAAINREISPLLLVEYQSEKEHGEQELTRFEDLEQVPDVRQSLLDMLDFLDRQSQLVKESLTPKDLTAFTAFKAGIPIGRIQGREQVALQNMEETLSQVVMGQPQAISAVAQALRRARAGLKEANKPQASFFFVGPTGTGKTELAKAIAELVFGDKQALLPYNMAEYQEEHAAALLYGAPPGYVGYKDGGLLVSDIRQRPYSVVLFDEIEKAHPNVFDVFLSLLDEGMVRDKLNRVGDFSQAVIIFTSNLGSDHIRKAFNHGEVLDQEQMKQLLQQQTSRGGIEGGGAALGGRSVFRPEFLARVGRFAPFAPITEEVARRIINLQVDRFRQLPGMKDIELILDQTSMDFLLEQGFSELYGARPLKMTIEQEIGTPLAEMIVAGEVQEGEAVSIELGKEQEKLSFRIKTNPN